jgi:glycosyltransferase involved in cell wall biosynthesis
MSGPIHVLEISKSTGGVGSYLRWLAQGFDHTRYKLTFVCLSEGGPELAADLHRIAGVRAISFAMNRYKIDPLSDARVLIRLAQIIRGEHFDLIHAHTSKPGYLARIAAAGSGIPVIYRPACYAFHDDASRLQRIGTAALERFAAKHLTARIMTVSNDERDLGFRHGVGRPDQVVTIHTGIDPAPFSAPVDRGAVRRSLGVPEDAPLVGVVGRLMPQKAPLDFVRAAAQVHAARPDAHFVWVGDGPLDAAARAEVAASGLSAVFHFAGLRRDIPAVLQAFDLFVLPSHWEGFSLSVLEAMAAGLPVVATDVIGTGEAIAQGESGLLVPKADSPALARAILTILSDPERARAYGAKSRERVAQLFTRERMIGQIAKLYDDVHAENQQRRLSRQLAH